MPRLTATGTPPPDHLIRLSPLKRAPRCAGGQALDGSARAPNGRRASSRGAALMASRRRVAADARSPLTVGLPAGVATRERCCGRGRASGRGGEAARRRRSRAEEGRAAGREGMPGGRSRPRQHRCGACPRPVSGRGGYRPVSAAPGVDQDVAGRCPGHPAAVLAMSGVWLFPKTGSSSTVPSKAGRRSLSPSGTSTVLAPESRRTSSSLEAGYSGSSGR